MSEEQVCDYDRSVEPKEKKKKAKKKAAPKADSYGSMSENLDRLRINGNQKRDVKMDDDLEEEEILQRELMDHS